MDEMISRVAAIDAIEKHIRTAEEPYQLTYADKVMNHAFEIAASCVYNLSATEPEVRTQMSSADCISRSAAIDATWFEPSYTDPLNVLTEVRDRLKVLPPVQPERKRGKWTKISPASIYECSVCGQNIMTQDIDVYSYCHGCGADMREVDDERLIYTRNNSRDV